MKKTGAPVTGRPFYCIRMAIQTYCATGYCADSERLLSAHTYQPRSLTKHAIGLKRKSSATWPQVVRG